MRGWFTVNIGPSMISNYAPGFVTSVRGISKIHLVKRSCETKKFVTCKPCAIHYTSLPKQLPADRKVPYALKNHQHEHERHYVVCVRKDTDPASCTVTKVKFPAVRPLPPAARTVPANFSDSMVIQGSALVATNSLWNLCSSASTHRSLP